MKENDFKNLTQFIENKLKECDDSLGVTINIKSEPDIPDKYKDILGDPVESIVIEDSFTDSILNSKYENNESFKDYEKIQTNLKEKSSKYNKEKENKCNII